MDESVMRCVAVSLMSGALLYSAFLPLAAAQVLADPTRPPGIDSTEDAAVKGPVVQSILIAPGRREAIINGRAVRVGEQFGEARVVAISDAEVVLRSGSELQTLKLFPAIEKQVGVARGNVKTNLREQGK